MNLAWLLAYVRKIQSSLSNGFFSLGLHPKVKIYIDSSNGPFLFQALGGIVVS